MKKMCKLLSLLLVLSILCTIFVVPVSADFYSTQTNLEITTIITSDNRFNCKGEVNLRSNALNYEVFCKNNSGPQDIYNLYAQCVIFYSDDSYDLSYIMNNPNIGHGHTESYPGTMYFATGKTVVGFDAEFRVSFQGEMVWEAILATPVTLGINA